MDDVLLHNSVILFEIICVIAVFAYFIIRSYYFTEILEHHPRIVTRIILMVFYGLISIVGTVTGIGLFGSIGNVRDIGPMIAGLTCGPVIGIGAGIIGGAFRFMQGGPYMYTGLSAPIFCGIMGGILYLANNRDFVSTRIATLYMLLCDTLVSIVTLTLVTSPDQLWSITRNIAIPMIIGSTVGVFLFSSFIHAQIVERKRDLEYKRLEREHADKKNLDSIINTLADPVFVIDQNFCWRLVNDQFCQLIGKNREDIIGRPIADFFIQEEYEAIRSQSEAVFQSLSSIETEMVLTGADGQKDTVISKITLYTDSNGCESVVGIIRNISERKKMEEIIRDSETRLTSVLEGSPMMQFVIDHNHRVISWNKAIEKFTGVPSHGIIGTTDHWKPFYQNKRPLLADILVDEVIPNQSAWFFKNLTPAKHGEGAYEGTEFMPDMGSCGRWIYYTAAPVRDTGGSIIGAVETLVDISERTQIESALKLTLKKLNLLSSITRHDILNKLTILSGSLYLAIESVHEPEGIEHLIRAKNAADIIQQQIAFTREYQELGIKDPVWQEISVVARAVIKEMDDSTITFHVSTSPFDIYADPLLIKVFYNLFDNARQHGETVSRITITDTIVDNTLIIKIADDGVGIVNENKALIFERGFGNNTGFGLFLSSEILAITGISIRETGTPGIGAVFEIIVPASGYRVVKPNNQDH
ncbi:MAG TPA: LytS/YhcK type 5TM receptor domain-containing protein [Methanospirillum sp.]|nr:LytS/YhcK type 5TM receptor domain-containing protein [Methanospirillum sp.]